MSPCGDQLIVSELFGAAPSREHIKRRPKKGELPPQYMFDKDTLTALHRGDVSGARHAVHRYVVLPQVPNEPLAPRFQTVCRAYNTHKFSPVNLVGTLRRIYKILCEPMCKHAHLRAGVAVGHIEEHVNFKFA